MDNNDPSSDDNRVFLRGRLAASPVVRRLPSGDELCSFRLTIPRPAGSRARVDSIDCATTRLRVRKSLERADPGDQFEVTGSLHRRFWRSPAGPASRFEVEVVSARISARRRTCASPAQRRVSG
ncbi:MAG: single-stranded DNA-binding protein [Pseudonocardiales bacterium]|nr:MAG: single-stranded DNA-binding protein [Pseudonocardiales bacterium]